MRIGFPMFGFSRTGSEKVISKLANAICRRGHEVSLGCRVKWYSWMGVFGEYLGQKSG